MQTQSKYFIGIDVSKGWFDLSLMSVLEGTKAPMVTARFDNNKAGFKRLDGWLKQHRVPFTENTLAVIENTGVYHRLIWQYCSHKGLPLHIGNAAAIKWSLGITRGKDDVTDSQRLCDYCFRQADKLKAAPVLDPVIMELKDLSHSRTRIIEQINNNRVYLKELTGSNSAARQKALEKVYKAALDGLRQTLEMIEARIKEIVMSNSAIKANYHLLLSVPGLGPVTSLYIICCTANFAGGISGKQLASYAGVVPFGNTSGKTIKGKPKVHKMSNKELKALLHMGARSVANHHPEFRTYYQRKLQEGKHDLTIINAIKNKIVLRAVSVVTRQIKYVDNYKKVE